MKWKRETEILGKLFFELGSYLRSVTSRCFDRVAAVEMLGGGRSKKKSQRAGKKEKKKEEEEKVMRKKKKKKDE